MKLEMEETDRVASIPFGRRRIGPDAPVVVIAEIGVNHEGSVEQCARMVEEAARAGADAIKLQTIDADENYVVGSESHKVFKGAGLTREETARMFELARSLGMEPLTTAGDFNTLQWVEALQPAAHKVSSGLLTHLPLIRRIAGYSRPILISSGMAEEAELDTALKMVRQEGADKIALFQCTSLYPAPPETLNLATMERMSRKWEVPVGFSDHSLGDEAAALAVAAGASMIEKHFTLDPSRSGLDHHISVDPEGLRRLVTRVRQAETVMGKHVGKESAEILGGTRKKFMRCLVVRRALAAGERFTEENLTVKRPLPEHRGLEPARYDEVLGCRAVRDLAVDEPVTEGLFE